MNTQKDIRIILAENVLTMLRWREEYHREHGNIDMSVAYGCAADMLWCALNQETEDLAQFDYSKGDWLLPFCLDV